MNEDSSIELTATRHLNEAQKVRLAELLEEYLTGLECGLPPSLDDLVRDNTELVLPLRNCVAGLENLHRMAGGLTPQVSSPGAGSEVSAARRLGDFELFEEIGRGGMGIVHRGRQVSLDRIVAIKLLPFAAVLDPRQIARFQNEAQAAGSLHHPHIVPVHAVGCERGVHFYAMQFIDGESMDTILSREDRQSASLSHESADWQSAVELAIQAAEALHAAHEFGIVHRDVKPSNLMLDKQNKIWITDFGLARCQRDVALTHTGDVVGTVKYMSPEQARGDSALVDGRTDIYSLGATLYEMICGKPAHDGADVPSILRMIEQDRVVPLRTCCPDIPRDLETVVQKAMSKTRDGRYATAKEFADDLGRVLRGEPTIARPLSAVDRTALWAAKHRQAVLVTIVICILGFVGSAISTALIAAQKQISDANGARATRNEELARGAVDRLGTQMAELLAEIPAAEQVRRRLLLETLDYFQRFADQAGDDPQLRHDLAITYGKIGALQSELGSPDKALPAFKKSQQLFARLSAESPGNATLALQWTISQNNLAEMLHRDGQLENAARWFARTINEQERLLQRDSFPSQTFRDTAELELATTLNNLGLLLAENGATDEAEERYRRAIDLLGTADSSDHERHAANEPGEGSRRKEQLLASINSNLAGMLAATSPARAIHYAQLALDQQTRGLRRDRGDARLATETILTLNTLGTAYARQTRHISAIESFQRAIDIGAQLRTRWPDQATYRRDLGLSWNHLGMSLTSLGRMSEAEAAFERSLDEFRTLGSQFQTDAEVQSILGSALHNLGFVQQQRGAREEALQSYREAVQYQNAAVELCPAVSRYQTYLAKHQHNLRELVESESGKVVDRAPDHPDLSPAMVPTHVGDEA